MSSITTSALDTPARRSLERTCDDLAIVVLAAVTLVAGLTFRDYGLGWDDYTHAEYADLLLRMYGSGFKDTGALQRIENGHARRDQIGIAFASAAHGAATRRCVERLLFCDAALRTRRSESRQRPDIPIVIDND